MAVFQKQSYELNGKQIDTPLDWRSAKVIADFNDNVQAKLSIESLVFVNEGVDDINEHINQGRIFEAMDLLINVQDSENTLTVFDGLLDPSTFEQITPNKIECRVIAKDGLDTLKDKLESLTCLYLYKKGYLQNQTDINFVVEPKFDAVYFISTLTTIFLLQNVLQDAIATNAKDVQNVISLLSSSATPNPVGSIAYGVAVALANGIYTGVIIIGITKLVKELINSLIQQVRQHKAISWETVLNDASKYLGYGFNTSIPNLDKWIQIPSNQSNELTVTNGIPKAQDYGYILYDFFNQVSTAFNGRYAVIDGVIEFHPVWSDFWLKNSSGKVPSNIHEKETFRYNTADLVRSREVVFSFDLSDDYSANENYRAQGGGVISQGLDNYKDLLTGYESYRINHSLGNRKDGLTRLEKVIKELAKLADEVVGFFGQSSNLANKVKNRIGMLRVSTPNHGLSKLVYSSGGNLPSNHNEFINADYLYKTYYYPSSLANGGQKKIFEGVRVPFNLSLLNSFLKNSYFIGNSGAVSKINRIEWNIDDDEAIIDYEEEFTYTNKLTEEFL